MDSLEILDAVEAQDWLIQHIDEGHYFELDSHPELGHWMDLTRLVNDMQQLHEVFLWNHAQLINGVQIYMNDTLQKIIDNGSSQAENIIINGYAMNYFSSGINLISFLQSISNHEKKRGFKNHQAFDALRRKAFDEDFNYALSYTLRNYSQHGQLIASIYLNAKHEKAICFDLFQILNSALVDTNAKAKKRFEKIYCKLMDYGGNPVRISFAGLTDAYFVSICELYEKFLELFFPYLDSCAKKVQKLLNQSSDRYLTDPGGNKFSILIESGDSSTAHIILGEPAAYMRSFQDEIHLAEKKTLEANARLEKTTEAFQRVSDDAP